ncbi:protein lethal(2)essential for life-like [Maniola jurtina]|uniref:protein lethal(2)essential for life-like n=1 Tax=Maniola jurtina TaxID=191418 RepID=UPI001E68ABBB|nr:protein lethal(2)essential for life-like [Maniola jurtina]
MEKLMKLFLVAIIFGAVQAEEQCPQKRQANVGNRLIDQDFGLELTPDDLITSMMSPFMFRDYFRPWRYMEALTRDLGSTIKTEKDKFTINLDVQHFAPEEISVKTADGYVTIEAKHEEKKDEHGLISRQFVRKYSLPEGVEPENVVSQLSSDGILTITAPRKEVEGKGERVVPITQTGPVRKEAKESKEDKSCSAEKCN